MPSSEGLDTPRGSVSLFKRFQTPVWRALALKLDMRKHVPRKYSPRGRRLEEGQLGNLDVLLLRQQFCAALIEPALHIPERDLFA